MCTLDPGVRDCQMSGGQSSSSSRVGVAKTSTLLETGRYLLSSIDKTLGREFNYLHCCEHFGLIEEVAVFLLRTTEHRHQDVIQERGSRTPGPAGLGSQEGSEYISPRKGGQPVTYFKAGRNSICEGSQAPQGVPAPAIWERITFRKQVSLESLVTTFAIVGVDRARPGSKALIHLQTTKVPPINHSPRFLEASGIVRNLGHDYYPENQLPGMVSNVDSLTGAMSSFQGMSLGHSMGHNGTGMGQMSAHTYMVPQDYILAPHLPGAAMGMDQLSQGPYGPAAGGYLAAPGQFNPYVPYGMMPFTPGRAVSGNAVLQDRTNRNHNDVPGLENRRHSGGSYSTTESAPTTPFYNGAKNDKGPRVAALDRSTYTTPSPQQIVGPSMFVEPAAKHGVISIPVDRNLEEMLKQEPPIPKAVPAVFTPAAQMKTLDQSLENRIPGNRNVYIRGLHPTTDDELLYRFASRFGEVETSKAIIDTATGACKGFGFAKFFDVRDSEMCIRGFHRLGYEVGFARESFNSRLKAEGDEGSTNLYISNLPKSLTENDLGDIFRGYHIMSSKILRDSMGNSRGVGFARFESRDVCDAVIKQFNGIPIGEEGMVMNIRYADTPGQKELKRVTAERRQFRTNEYNIGAYGTPLVGIQPNMYNQPAWKRALHATAHTAYAPRSLTGGLDRMGKGVKSEGYQAGNTVQGKPQSAVEVSVEASNADDSDEGVTIHADATTPVIVSTQSSPVVKKERKEQKEQK
ncbi:Sporulation-specific protein 5 [Colletotrichum fructicola Nara gc5]|uniref:Sporulation-specific protein 5 n=1 Tax=Colletotrichum fructicola (strain Nara gc5) TaxID=1213859 RepID=A0A7J6JIN7_COLFN|nr:Sporulation-specific protein 5 [Colletotrichum fructicola Nara gc5]